MEADLERSTGIQGDLHQFFRDGGKMMKKGLWIVFAGVFVMTVFSTAGAGEQAPGAITFGIDVDKVE
jgi:hypothetical protein